jgi:HD-like signal output (HDOD) protein
MTYALVLEKVSELPTLSAVIAELSELINDPMSSTGEVARLIEGDMSISTKIFRLANSAMYAAPGGVKSLDRAVTILGFDTAFQAALSTSVIAVLATDKDAPFDIRRFWQHSIGVAFIAEALGAHFGHQEPHSLFAAGLVHDMGKVALLKIDQGYVAKVAAHAKNARKTFAEAEEDLGALRHAIVGQMLCQAWRLPAHMQSAVRHHHTLSPAMRPGLSLEMAYFVDIVALANILAHNVSFGGSGYDIIPRIPDDLMDRLSVKAEDMPAIRKKIGLALEKSTTFTEIVLGGEP